MDTDGKNTTQGNTRGNITHHTLPDMFAEGGPTAAVAANMSQNRSKWAAGGCIFVAQQANLGHPLPGAPAVIPVKLSDGFLPLDGLKKAEEAMVGFLFLQAVAEYSSSSSSS